MSTPHDPWKDVDAEILRVVWAPGHQRALREKVDAARAADAARYKAFRDAVAAALCVENEDGPVSDEAIIEAADVPLTQLCEESSEIATLRATVDQQQARITELEADCACKDRMVNELRFSVTHDNLVKAERRITALEAALKGVTSTQRWYLCWCDNSWNTVEHGHQPKCNTARQALETP